MPASWLAQMAWDVYVLDDIQAGDLNEKGPWKAPLPEFPSLTMVDAKTASTWIKDGADVCVIDLSTHANYVKGHIPGSWFALRSQFVNAIGNLPQATRYILTSTTGELAAFAAPEIQQLIKGEVSVLSGGNKAWIDAGLELEKGATHLASPPMDRYKRPYEGTSVDPAAMQAYLDWEFGLVEQLGKDGTHHFWVL
jgi:rhodanese-related sulfurtransferase